MRLRDYQNLIKRAIPIILDLDIPEQSIPGHPTIFRVLHIQKFLKIIKEFKNANLFYDEIKGIVNIPNFTDSIEDSVVVNNESRFILKSIKENLLSSTKLLETTLNRVLTKENENVLNIKLPNEYSSINDYVTFFTELESICFPFKYIQQEIAIVNFDVGSKWIGIEFPDSVSAGFFVTLASKGADFFNKVLEGRKIISEIEKNKAEQTEANINAINATIDIINKNQKNELENYKERLIEEAIAESKLILKECINKNEFDNFVRIALGKLGSLLIKGMEIVPALNAKPEVKQLSEKATANIEEKRKLIIGCDNLKYITLQDSNINSKDIPADTVEINNDDK